MQPEPEVDRVSSSLFVWHRYAPDVKAELFSTAVLSSAGAYIIDPISIKRQALLKILGGAPVAGIVITNENHGRDAEVIAAAFSVPIFAHPAARAALELTNCNELSAGSEFAPGLTAIAVDGAPAGEIAVYSEAEKGSLIIGDALINMGSYGFSLLPAKYCSNQKRMRKSLLKLLDYDFERIVFAHGLPIVADAKQRLRRLLEGGTKDTAAE